MTTRTRGRPSLYRDEYAQEAYKLCLLGATDQELGGSFGVHRDTIHEWKRSRPDFSDAITRGKMLADAEVAAKLYERACGYVVNAVKLYRQDDGSVLQVPYQIEHPPDTRAANLWLRNRQPHRWRDKHQVDVAHAGESLLDDLTEEQLIERMLQRRETARRKPN